MSIHARTVPAPGAVLVRRALALAGCGVLTVAVSACESTEQESAKIGREAQQPASSERASRHAAVSHGAGTRPRGQRGVRTRRAAHPARGGG